VVADDGGALLAGGRNLVDDPMPWCRPHRAAGAIVPSQTPTTRYLRRIDDRTYEDGDKVNGRATVSRRIVIAADGRTLTVTMIGTNADGQMVNKSLFTKNNRRP
jgi:hypothetical protein